MAAIPLQQDEPMLVWLAVVEPAGRTMVYGSPLTRTSRSPRRFHSWPSIGRL
ncbi:MAG: hypothetical protein ABJA98_06635 [Acidobacteriota bacterium]